MTTPVGESPLAGLDPILGRWKTSGTVFDGGGAIEARVSGTDTYRLLPAGAWIAHEVDVRIGQNHTVAHELIGGEHPDGGWTCVSTEWTRRQQLPLAAALVTIPPWTKGRPDVWLKDDSRSGVER
ncbi:hypothetical protein BFL43_18265 [Williamsia sp. 1135]|nr:hypothetical protein BFL43_18265 [Williamsia sp. 1135]